MLLGKKSTQKQLMIFLKKNHKPFFTFLNFTSDVHNKKLHLSSNSQQQHYPESIHSKNTKSISHGQPTITRWLSTIHETHSPIQGKRPKIMEMTVSWKRFNNKIERNFEEESFFED